LTESFGSPPLATPVVRQELARGAFLLDTRPAEQFAAGHLRGALHVDLRGRFAAWAALLIRASERLLLIAENVRRANEARERLARVGLTHVVGYSQFEGGKWLDAGMELARMPLMYCKDVGSLLQEQSVRLIDARSHAEWRKGHLPGAIAMPLLELAATTLDIIPVRRGFVYCQQGFRATTAASILLRRGVADVGVLFDGIEGWMALGWPLTLPTTASCDLGPSVTP
jgi:rhodanese-related sulfurtransferase